MPNYKIHRGFSAGDESFLAGEVVQGSFLVEVIGEPLVKKYTQSGRIEEDTDMVDMAAAKPAKAIKPPAGAALPPTVTRDDS